ncbi:MAG: hypothetical protein K5776_06220 [Lachnospiraceae bacterium]|nr:hypothetical protein [Lachnospiraceae bacterium]
MKNIKDLRTITNMSQQEFAEYLHIPKYNIQNWEQGSRRPLDYVLDMIERIMVMDNYDLNLINEKSYLSTEHKITFYLVPQKEGEYDIVFYYDNHKYQIPAPFIDKKIPEPDYSRTLIGGSSFYVDDKIDDIFFSRKAGLI